MRLVFIMLLACSFCALSHTSQLSDMVKKLDEASDYLTVNPAQSITILDSINGLQQASAAQFIRWHLINARAAVPTAQYDRLYQSIDAVFSHHHSYYFQQKLTTVMSALGIWLRHEEYLPDAKLSFQCAFRYAESDRQRLTLSNSMALLARSQNDYEQARNLYGQSHSLAIKLALPNVVAMIENNLGYLALDEGRVVAAERYFRSALIRYQAIDKRAGQISAGLNLLLVFLVQEQQLNYDRLYGPTATLTEAFPNDAKQALLHWLEAGYAYHKGDTLTAEHKAQLQSAFKQLQSDKMRAIIYRYFAKPMQVAVDLPQAPLHTKRFSSPWFELVKECAW